MTLQELRIHIEEVKNVGLQIQSHYKKLEKEYSDWEDDFNRIQNRIDELKEENGLTEKEILEDPWDNIGEASNE